MPKWVRYAVAGSIVACMAYAFVLLNAIEHGEVTPDIAVERIVPVPELDERILAETRDATRSERLLLDKEPLRHLLAKAIDVGPSVAAALGIPAEMVPVAELRADIDDWRYRWLWYEGRVVNLSGPRDGHPIANYKIYEAILELADGEHVLTAFSIEPDRTIEVGGWARAEGYLYKLRDLTYPIELQSAPMLVGRCLQRDYEDWPPVTELDQELLDRVDDSSWWPRDLPFRTVDEDQSEALWHLGAFARDTRDRMSLAEWRKVPPIPEFYEQLKANEVRRGEPMRVFGTLIRRQTIAAGANPANIKFWTAVWVQVSGFGGMLMPIWVPKQVRELPLRAQLEVRGYYYRWFRYDTQQNRRIQVPLLVAADLDLFDLATGETMREIGIWIGGVALLMLVLIFWGQRQAQRSALAHSRMMDERRRKRRERARANATTTTAEAERP
ncbi:MAG TPA: hypothetical protein ENI87_10630 [bacterium]|nr:hypothetical protein [bacterium]